MRFYRNLIILAVVFLALLAAYMFLPKQDAENPEAKKISVKSFNKDKIIKIELNNSKGLISFSKSGADWKMVEPKDYKLDKVSTDSFIKGVINIKADDIVEEDAKNLDKYELIKPSAKVIVKSTDGTNTIIMLGGESPIGGVYYLKTSDSNTVYRVDSYTAGEFLRGLTEFRDKSVFSFKPVDIAEMVLSKQGKEIWEFSKQEDWKVTEAGTQSEGNQTEISNTVDEVSGLKVQEYMGDSPVTDLVGYGLANPQYMISIKLDTGVEEKLILGKSEDTWTYAKKTSGTEVFKINKDNLNILSKDPKIFIRK